MAKFRRVLRASFLGLFVLFVGFQTLALLAFGPSVHSNVLRAPRGIAARVLEGFESTVKQTRPPVFPASVSRGFGAAASAGVDAPSHV